MSLPEIKQLSPELYNLISAGEVVERPASVVKELIENALDAGATTIKIDLLSSGNDKIMVLDNGCGMLKEQIPLSILPHATSKIKSSSDLFSITTLGFRGEALPSIASVSRMIITSSVDGNSGYFYEYRGGELVKDGVKSLPKGTKVEVEHLFYNTPARFKHLGSEQLELSHITTLVNRMALANPYIAFSLTNNAKLLFKSDGSGSIPKLIAQIYGLNVAKYSVYFEAKNDLYEIKGYTTTNNVFRSNKNAISVIINNRIIRNINILFAVTDAYKSIIPVGKFPITVLEIICDPSLIDVNVHPSKLEIRFTDEVKLKALITDTINKTLSNADLVYEAEATDVKNTYVSSTNIEDMAPKTDPWDMFSDAKPEDNIIKSKEEIVPTEEQIASDAILEQKAIYEEAPLFDTGCLLKEDKKVSYGEDNEDDSDENNDEDDDFVYDDFDSFIAPIKLEETKEENKGKEETVFNENTEALNKPKMEQTHFDVTKRNFTDLKYIGQFHLTYLLFEDDTNLYLIDQHAAMERIRYERIIERLKTKDATCFDLLIPLRFDFAISEISLIMSKEEELKELGISIESFGGTTIIVRQIPTWIPKDDAETYVSDIILKISNDEKVSRDILFDDLAKQLACKGSIKANMHILDDEVKQLLKDLDTCKMPYTCPHGRPTLVKLTTYEIEKLFKRVI